jgi:cob(I)alamin adenosyltransferase
VYRLQPRRPRPHFLDLYRRPIGVRHGLSPSLALDAADTIPAGGQEPYLKTSAAGVLSPDALAGIPDSIQALIAARLDTLSPERRALLQNAAVVGTVFWSGALLATSDRDPSVIRADLEDLAARAFIRPAPDSSVAGEVQYSFWHPLTREVAYGQLPRMARIHKHRAVARWIERVAGERVTDHAELLTYHYLTALELAEAARAAEEITRLQEPTRRALVMGRRPRYGPGRYQG